MKTNFTVGDRVIWHDPDEGLCDGPGTIVAIGDEDDDEVMFPDTVIYLKMDDGGELNCYPCELEDLA